MRDARMGQVHAAQAAQAAAKTMVGTYTRLRPGESLEALRKESAKHPIVLHLGLVTGDAPVDNNQCVVVAEQMSRVAPSFAEYARLVTDLVVNRLELPVWLQVPTLPALVTPDPLVGRLRPSPPRRH